MLLFFFFFEQTESVTEVLGPTELYIECGSTINLTCVIRESPEPPAYIIWTHNNMVRKHICAQIFIIIIRFGAWFARAAARRMDGRRCSCCPH